MLLIIYLIGCSLLSTLIEKMTLNLLESLRRLETIVEYNWVLLDSPFYIRKWDNILAKFFRPLEASGRPWRYIFFLAILIFPFIFFIILSPSFFTLQIWAFEYFTMMAPPFEERSKCVPSRQKVEEGCRWDLKQRPQSLTMPLFSYPSSF